MDGSTAEDALENRVPGVMVELMYNDDKENAPNTDDIRNMDENILCEHSALVKSKVKEIHKIHNELKKSTKEIRPAATIQGVKYIKLKPTNPKPFRLRTDCTENEVSAAKENVEKKADDKTLKKVQFTLVKSKYMQKSKKVAPVFDSWTSPCSRNKTRRTKYPTLRKLVLPQRFTIPYKKNATGYKSLSLIQISIRSTPI